MADLKTFLEKETGRFSDELLYIAASAYCKDAALGKREKGDLYYALLNWRDTHDQVRENLARLNDTYEVCWYENGQPHREVFNVLAGDGSPTNPYIDARMRYGNLVQTSGVEYAELRMYPNEYKSGPERNGRLLETYERKEDV